MNRPIRQARGKQGFAPIIIIILVAIATVLGVGYLVKKNNENTTTNRDITAAFLELHGDVTAQDASRYMDLDVIKRAISIYLDNGGTKLCADKSTIYSSAPIAIPTGWKAGSNVGKRSIDGTGWLPVPLTEILPINKLPVDPINEGRLVYIYACDPVSRTFEVSAEMEGEKYRNLASTDGGLNNERYEMGTNMSLIPGSLLWSTVLSAAATVTSTQDVTAGWKTYRNERFGFEQYGFEFKYPSDWKAEVDRLGTEVAFKPQSENRTCFQTNAICFLDIISDIVPPPPDSVKEVKQISVGGRTAKRFINVENSGTDLVVIFLSNEKDTSPFSVGHKIGLILNSRIIGNENMSTFDQILSTFKFLK